MLETFKNFIAGEWTISRSDGVFEDENPASRGSNLGLFQASTGEDVSQAITAAEDAFRKWRRTPLSQRQQYIAGFLRLLRESREELTRIVTLENGRKAIYLRG